MTVQQALFKYLKARGITMPRTTRGQKVAEEGNELRDAICAYRDAEEAGHTGKLPELELAIKHEIADVIFSAGVVAWNFSTTAEECMALKIAYDEGRNKKPGRKRDRPAKVAVGAVTDVNLLAGDL